MTIDNNTDNTQDSKKSEDSNSNENGKDSDGVNSEPQLKPEEIKALLGRVSELEAEQARTKAHNQKIIDEKRDTERKAKEKELTDKGKFEELLALSKQEIAERDDRLNKIAQAEEDRKLEAKAAELASKLATEVRRHKSLTKEIKSRLQLTEDGLKVTDENGKLTISTIDQLLAEMQKNFDYMCDGLGSSGTGSKGSGGSSSGTVKKLGEMTEKEQVELYTNDYATWQKLKQTK